ncbi:MAG: helix-hairpin-helix domain-containing protein, partial [Clostridia bacterium]|nr:helix-hairpin-helix domain-containing protein [Clostridia bacterium]
VEHLGKKTAQNLVSAIEGSKNAGLSRLIYALGIRNVGRKSAELLAQHFKTLDAVMDASVEDICTIEGFGEAIAGSVVSYFSLSQSKNLIERLKEYGVLMEAENRTVSNRLEGLTFVLTGTLPTMTRTEASALITENGGNVSSSVSKKTSYVLAGEEAGSKLTKAQSLGVPIIDQQEFLNMIQ